VSELDFKPINCRKCGNLVWSVVSATSRCDIKLDIDRLNIVQEIEKLSTGIGTYQIHRTSQSFEATRRTPTRMGAKEPIVLATHTCRSMTIFISEPPEYFERAGSKKEPLGTTTSEVPF
jgi:hypothetical protein